MNVTMQPKYQPTLSPTLKYEDLIFACYYNDNDVDYYTLSFTLLEYANIMESQILDTMEAVDGYPARFDISHSLDRSIPQYRRGGIDNLKICRIFNDKELTSNCPAYTVDDTIKAQYIAVGSFDIIAVSDIHTYRQHIMGTMQSNDFKHTFSAKMNDKLLGGDMHRRRRLLQTLFSAVYIQVIDLNDVDAQYALTTEMTVSGSHSSSSHGILNIVMILIAIGLVSIICILAFVWDHKKNVNARHSSRPHAKKKSKKKYEHQQIKAWDMNQIVSPPQSYNEDGINMGDADGSSEVILASNANINNSHHDSIDGILNQAVFVSNAVVLDDMPDTVLSMVSATSNELINRRLPEQPSVDPYYENANSGSGVKSVIQFNESSSSSAHREIT